MRTLVFLVAFVPLLVAQSTVEGVVVESVAKTPVSGASVQVIWTKPLTGTALIHGVNTEGPKTTTDDAGRFRIEVPSPSEFTLRVSKEGFSPLEGGAAGRFTLKEHESKRRITLTLEAEGVIEGRVYDPDLEKPVAGLPVQSWIARRFGPTKPQYFPSKSATTNAEGVYRLEGLQPGKYRVSVGPSRRMALQRSANRKEKLLIYPRVFFPGVVEAESSTELDLPAGGRLSSIDLGTHRKAAYRVSGKVVRSDGNPLAGSVVLTHESATQKFAIGWRQLGVLEGTGTFELEPVEEGSFRLLARIEGETRADWVAGRVTVDVASKDINGLEVVLRGGVTVTGTLHSEDNAPGQKDPLWTLAERDIMVDVRRPVPNINKHEWPVPVDRSSGEWNVEGAPLERVAVKVTNLPAGFVVTSMTYNGAPTTLGLVDLNPAAIAHEIRITVAGVSNSISGAVMMEGKPVPGAIVAVLREPVEDDSQTWQRKGAQATERGRYALGTLEPGWYRICAIEPAADYSDLLSRLGRGDCKRSEVGKTTNVTLDLVAQ